MEYEMSLLGIKTSFHCPYDVNINFCILLLDSDISEN